jgi:hypothetical protein
MKVTGIEAAFSLCFRHLNIGFIFGAEYQEKPVLGCMA